MNSSPALRTALEENLQLLGSPAGVLVRRILPQDPSGELLLEINYKAKGRRDGPNVTALVEMSLTVRPAQAAGDTTSFKIASSFRIVYVLAPGPEIGDDEAQRVADANGVFNAWPYFRELLQSTMARCGLPAVLLPVLRIGDLAARPPVASSPAPKRRRATAAAKAK